MKRFKKWVVDGVTEKWHECKANWRKNCSVVIAVICTIVVGSALFMSWDNTPATEEDYQPLEQQAEDFEKRFDAFVEDGDIPGDVTATFKNDECELSVSYNPENKEYTITKKDNSVSWWLAAVLIFFVCFWVYSIVFAVTGGILLSLDKLHDVIRKAKDKKKNKS